MYNLNIFQKAKLYIKKILSRIINFTIYILVCYVFIVLITIDISYRNTKINMSDESTHQYRCNMNIHLNADRSAASSSKWLFLFWSNCRNSTHCVKFGTVFYTQYQAEAHSEFKLGKIVQYLI